MADGGDQERAAGWNRVLGYAVGGVAVVLATIAVVALVVSIGDGSDDNGVVDPGPAAEIEVDEAPDNVLPDGGLFKIPDDVDGVAEGAKAADCELKSFAVRSNDHVADSDPPVRYPSDPPAGGEHDPVPAQDGAYAVSPGVQRLVHTLEHGRVIVWFDRDLPRAARASLKAYFDDDSRLMILVPDTTDMEYDVAATAWNRKPGKYGTGRLLGCREYSDDVYTALEAFKKRNRGKGPELIP
jgi:hypothetical protein